MPRYIDADDFRKTMIKRFGCIPCLSDYSEASRYDIPLDDALNLAPTADVVPKSEVEFLRKTIAENAQQALDVTLEEIEKAKADVAREIFEEIEEYAEMQLEGLKIAGMVKPISLEFFAGGTQAFCLLLKHLAKLKKKYTEGA